jgi:hypothetical protein
LPVRTSQYSGHPENIDDAEFRQMILFPDYFDFHGPEPELKQLKDLDAVLAFTDLGVRPSYMPD